MSGDRSDAYQPFPSTHWPMVDRAGDESADKGRPVLNELLKRYLPALRAHLVCDKKLPVDQADDLLQEFVVQKVLEKDLVSRADVRRGKFRTFLLTSLNRFVISQFRKRSTGKGLAASPTIEDLDIVLDSRSDSWEPAKAFEITWAKQVIEEAQRRMKMECDSGGRTEVWAVFQDRVVHPVTTQEKPLPYHELIRQIDVQSSRQAANILVTAKRMFVRNLRLVISEHSRDKREVDEEVDVIWSVLSQ